MTPPTAMVQRGGRTRVKVIPDVRGTTLKGAIRDHIEKSARIMTDEWRSYRGLHHEYASHETVTHRDGEYLRGDVTTNTVEAFFAILKRGIVGTFHNVSREHLQRYLDEFSFRWNTKDVSDGERIRQAILAGEGRRLRYAEEPSPG